jgi:hypothetical protein
MKNTKRLLALLLAVVLVLSLVACAKKDEKETGENTEPVIKGVQDLTVEAGSEINVLEGVTAEDAEDGDLTGMITLEASPELEFKNGKTVPPTAGNYELTYTVKDKSGAEVHEYATLTATRQTSEPVVYKQFDFSTQPVTDTHGWEARIGESAEATAELKQGAYVFDIANPGNSDGDVVLALPGYALTKADYVVKIWAKSTKDTYCHLIARDESVEDWATVGDAWNIRIGQKIAPVELRFSSAGEGSAELRLHLGKITPNPDNPDDTTPTDFTVTIDKIELYEITGDETNVPAYTADFTAADAVAVEASDGAEAVVEGDAVVINQYPTEGGVWSIKANLGLGDVTIEEGTKYYYTFTVNAENGVSGEALVESLTQYHEARANFNGISVAPGEDVVITNTFVAEKEVTDPVIRLQIGNAPEGATDNRITFKSLEFGTVEGDKETKKEMVRFIAFGNGTENATNPDCPWTTFNGTDEDNEHGVGTIWSEDGSFFYRIDDGGTVDWHNKLICGYGENPLTLASDSYYTVEITVKADKPVSCGVFLNPIGGWDPRFAESMDITTEEQTFSFSTKETFIADMDFELLFQFGSEALSKLDDVTVEFSNVTIYQMSVL